MADHHLFKRAARKQKLFQTRLIALGIVVFLLMIALIARLVFLQVYEHQFYTTLSKENHLGLIPIEPPRGLIYDRNGVLLAENLPIYSLDITPADVPNLKKTIDTLKKFINISDDDIQAFYKMLPQKRSFDPVPLKLQLTEDEVAKFALNQWRFPGVTVDARLMRYYPLGAAAAHVVGYMGRINAQELAEVDPENYSATNYIGKNGIEKYYEDKLHGTVGYQQVETDASGRIVRVLKRIPPVAGDTLYLTIDMGLEQIASQALGNDPGAVVVIQPGTGQVLAFVSNPSYDPNLFVRGITQTEYKALQDDPLKPLYDRAQRGQFPTASTVKPYFGLEALLSGVVTPQWSIHDPGYFVYGNHVYHNWKEGGQGTVNLSKAIMVSCDTYFFELATKVGISRMDQILTAFGFGKKTGIDLPDELPGLVPSPAWKKAKLHQPWYMGDTIVMGIGQGYLLATPLQMANAVATLSEHGHGDRPQLLLKTVSPNGIVTMAKPIPTTPVNIPDKDWDVIVNAMHSVITGGTGYAFRDAPYIVAGKTGTGQVFSASKHGIKDSGNLPFLLRDNSLFIAFAPIDNPQIAIAVVAEHTKRASKIARVVFDYYLLHKIDILPTNTSNPAEPEHNDVH